MISKNNTFYLISIIGSIIFTYYYFLYTNEYPPGSSNRIANFEADKMFQTRMLITTIANFFVPFLPFIKYIFQWLIPYPINYEVLLQIINVIFTFLLVISLPSLLKLFGYNSNKLTSLLIFVPITWNYIFINGFIDGAGLYYCFDIPSLTFFTIGLIFFLKRKWLIFYPVFILACLNRESAAFISVAGAFTGFNIKTFKIKQLYILNKNLLHHILYQIIIWFFLRVILSYAVKDNPGILFEQPQSMIVFLNHMLSGKPHWAMHNPAWFLSLFAGIWLLPFVYFHRLNSISRRLLLVGFIYIIILVFRSNMMEVRVYNELNVIVTVCAIIASNKQIVIKESAFIK